MASSDKDILHDWIDMETTPLDLVASWESLCDAYRTLEFSDPINDAMRLEEFKWIIHEMNKHLSRAKKILMPCKNVEAVRSALSEMFSPSGATTISGRRDLAYQKLRQMWVTRMLLQTEHLEEMEMEETSGTDF